MFLISDNQKNRLSVQALIRSVLILLIALPFFLELQNAQRNPIVPYHAYLELSIYVILFLIVIPFVRIKLDLLKIQTIECWVILFVLSLATTFWSPNPELVVQRSLMIYLTSLFLIIIAFSDNDPLQTYTTILKFLCWFGFGLASIALLIQVFGEMAWIEGSRVGILTIGPIKLEQVVVGKPPFYRISSLTGNPNSLAVILSFSLVATLVLYFTGKLNYFRFMIFSGIQLVALIFTFSRAGIGVTIINYVLFYSLVAKHHLTKFMRMVTIIFLIIGISLLAVQFAPSWIVDGIEQRTGVGLNVRDEMWVPLINSIIERPLTGVGFGVSSEAVLLKQNIEKSAHNAHLAILSEIGIIGYLLLLGIWCFAIIIGFRFGIQKTTNQNMKVAFLSAGVLLIGLFIHQIFETSVLRFGARNWLWVYLICTIVNLYCKVNSYYADERIKVVNSGTVWK